MEDCAWVAVWGMLLPVPQPLHLVHSHWLCHSFLHLYTTIPKTSPFVWRISVQLLCPPTSHPSHLFFLPLPHICLCSSCPRPLNKDKTEISYFFTLPLMGWAYMTEWLTFGRLFWGCHSFLKDLKCLHQIGLVLEQDGGWNKEGCRCWSLWAHLKIVHEYLVLMQISGSKSLQTSKGEAMA